MIDLYDDLPDGWSKIKNSRPLVCFKKSSSTEIYDEKSLRKNLVGFLSDDSFALYGGENFCDLICYYKTLEWFMEGLKLFYKD